MRCRSLSFRWCWASGDDMQSGCRLPCMRRSRCRHRAPRPAAKDLRLRRRNRGVETGQDLIAYLAVDEEPRLELEHALVEGREDRPYAVLVEMLHHIDRTLVMVE